jgi:hypothetical protein
MRPGATCPSRGQPKHCTKQGRAAADKSAHTAARVSGSPPPFRPCPSSGGCLDNPPPQRAIPARHPKPPCLDMPGFLPRPATPESSARRPFHAPRRCRRRRRRRRLLGPARRAGHRPGRRRAEAGRLPPGIRWLPPPPSPPPACLAPPASHPDCAAVFPSRPPRLPAWGPRLWGHQRGRWVCARHLPPACAASVSLGLPQHPRPGSTWTAGAGAAPPKVFALVPWRRILPARRAMGRGSRGH